MTAAALEWLSTGSCAELIAPASTQFRVAGGQDGAGRYPRPARPSAAQVWLPGVQ
jgi:hypothetical protein